MEKQYRNVVGDFEKSFNEEERSIVHVISVEVSDRYGDIVRADGMDKSHYEKNPVVLYGHDHSGFPVGKSLWQKETTLPNGAKAVIAKTQFADTEEGNTVFKLWKDGFLNAASIGFIPKELEPMKKDNRFVGYDIKKWELLEYSIVPIPANQEALRLALDEMGENIVVKTLREEMRRDLDRANDKKEMEELKADVMAMSVEVKDLKDTLNNLVEGLAKKIDSNSKSIAEIVAEKKAQRAEAIIADSIRRAISDAKK